MNAVATTAGAPTDRAKRTLYLLHFTPSMMAPETLEAMLVQREPLLSRSLGHVLESLRTGSRHHTLFVGPRGIGKTHLISLLHHRLSLTNEAKEKALIAWMREEEWGVTSFFELVLRILRTLDTSYPQLNIGDRTKELYDLPLAEAEKQAESLLLQVLADKCLVILLENLDDLFEQIGDHGQKAWRAFIQNHANMLLVCSTPSLFAGVSLQKSAFYGFFDIEPLTELEFEDVVALLGKIATERADTELATFIATPEGRARIRAVHHLAEGNPRIYIIFAQFLTKQALDELVSAFMHTLDELTPYYQARMKELSAQQRKIVEYLLAYRGAAPVKQIAKSCFITQQVCSSQLKQLKTKRYVRAIEQGRESFYELCEPLMRLCMEVKQQRGEPISLFVDMLRIWYRQEELERWMAEPDGHHAVNLRYAEWALAALRKDGDPKVTAILRDLQSAIDSKSVRNAYDLYRELECIGVDHQTVWASKALMIAALGWPPNAPEPQKQEIEQLDAGLATYISDIRTSSTDIVKTLTAVFCASVAIYKFDCQYQQKSFGYLYEVILARPSESVVALILTLGNCGDVARLTEWVKNIIQPTKSKFELNRFGNAVNEMFNAVTSGDQTKVLKLPSEQRTLIRRHLQAAIKLAEARRKLKNAN